jgi:hypothetical protein
MKILQRIAFLCLSSTVAALSASMAFAQRPAAPGLEPADRATIPVALDWVPAALGPLVETAEVKNSFVLDRTMLGATAALLPDSEEDARRSIRKLDGVSVRLYRFQDAGMIDPAQADLLREAYRARGWKHLVSGEKGATLHSGTTDLWLAVDGVDVRGGTFLAITGKSVSLVTFAGDLNPVDLLRLRGHFGIPNFPSDKLQDSH